MAENRGQKAIGDDFEMDDGFGPQSFKREYFFYQEMEAFLAKCRESARLMREQMIKENEFILKETIPDDARIIGERIEERERKYVRVYNPAAYDRFCQMCETAVRLAKECAMDVSVEFIRGTSGRIQFTFDSLALSDSDVGGPRHEFIELVSEADHVWIDRIDNELGKFIQLMFIFETYRMACVY